MSDSTDGVSAAEAESCAASIPDADSDHAVAAPWVWSHRAVLRKQAQQPALDWIRIVALALALALNLVALLSLTVPPAALPPAPITDTPRPATATASAVDGLQLVFVKPTPSANPGESGVDAVVTSPSAISMPNPTAPAPLALSTSPAALPPATIRAPRAVAPTTRVEPDSAALPPSSDVAPESAARLFTADGAIALPQATIEDLRNAESTKRRFAYITPGLAGAATAFSRQPALPYTPTRFDADWKPVRTLAGDIMVPLAEMLSFQNKRKTFGCSLLPPVCTWGRTDPGHELNDPLTLNPAEDAQCRTLWDQVVSTTDQTVWLSLRQRFDAECRKPLERAPLPPVADPA